MTELTGHRTQPTRWRPDDGPPFYLAECTRCREDWVIEIDDVMPETVARVAGEGWCSSHTCPTKASNWADEYLCDKQMGQYEEQA